MNSCPYCGGTGKVFRFGISGVMVTTVMSAGHSGGYDYKDVTKYEQLELDLPFPTAPVEFGEVIGWRVWAVDQGLLTSYAAHLIWPVGAIMNHRDKADIDLDPGGGNGFWALKDEKSMYRMFPQNDDSNLAYGTVWMWGDIIEHGNGYRSEFAAVRSIDYYKGAALKTRGGLFKKPVVTDLASLQFTYKVGFHNEADEFCPLLNPDDDAGRHV